MDDVGSEISNILAYRPRQAGASRNSPRTGSAIDGTGTRSPTGSNAGVSVTGE